MLTRTAAGRVYDYSHSVGRNGVSGLGFYYPVGAAVGDGDVVYVVNRPQETVSNVPWNRTAVGARISIVTIGDVPGDEEFVSEFGKYGDGEGEFIFPAGMTLTAQGHIHVTDEWLHRVSTFDKEGNLVSIWGTPGDAVGEMNGPSGIVQAVDGHLLIVDSRNHRIQRFTTDGKHLGGWGERGDGDGQLDSPWGITTDDDGYVYVADHKNHRIQKYTPDGEYAATFGSHGNGRGELAYPTGVAVDPDGDVYVADWANNRVQAFAPDGRFITTFIGDAQQPSKWAQMTIDANADVFKARRRVYTTEPEWRFALPTSVVFDPRKSRLLVTDTQRSRIQIYNKMKDYLDPQFNL